MSILVFKSQLLIVALTVEITSKSKLQSLWSLERATITAVQYVGSVIQVAKVQGSPSSNLGTGNGKNQSRIRDIKKTPYWAIEGFLNQLFDKVLLNNIISIL